MAQVPYAHVEAPRVLTVGGVRAYNPGDPVPLDVAERLGLLGQEDSPPVIGGTESTRERFVDSVITVTDESTANAGADTPTGDNTADPAAPTPPTTGDDSTTATPPQATAETPRRRGTSTTPTPES